MRQRECPKMIFMKNLNDVVQCETAKSRMWNHIHGVKHFLDSYPMAKSKEQTWFYFSGF